MVVGERHPAQRRVLALRAVQRVAILEEMEQAGRPPGTPSRGGRHRSCARVDDVAPFAERARCQNRHRASPSRSGLARKP